MALTRFKSSLSLLPVKTMSPRTREFLYFLLWSTDMLARPTFRNLTGSFESWMRHQGFQRQLRELERRKLLERRADLTGLHRHRLTERGRLLVLGGRDPAAAWGRSWDGRWRLVVFDLPETKSALRTRLRRFLKARGFGYLQDSVWVSPDPLGGLLGRWGGLDTVESLITLEACPCSGESNTAIVLGAWDFDRVNHLYQRCLKILEDPPESRRNPVEGSATVRRWVRLESEAWLEAVSSDPLLPGVLVPDGYRGPEVWEKRQRVLTRVTRGYQGGQ
jgi:phenylacetic acid degradation operon negative regulatory protein